MDSKEVAPEELVKNLCDDFIESVRKTATDREGTDLEKLEKGIRCMQRYRDLAVELVKEGYPPSCVAAVPAQMLSYVYQAGAE